MSERPQYRDEAFALWLSANSHYLAAKSLVATEPGARNNGNITPSVFMLAGFSIELSLKAVYLYLGGRPEIASDKIGHDLKKALIAAKAKGFVPNDDAIVSIIGYMRNLHRRHFFRYIPPHGRIGVPGETWLIDTLGRLVDQAGKIVRGQRTGYLPSATGTFGIANYPGLGADYRVKPER